MSVDTKYRVTFIVGLLGLPIAVYCLQKIITTGLGSESHQLKLWFGVLLGVVIIEIPVVITCYYLRAKLHSSSPDVGMEMLSKVGIIPQAKPSKTIVPKKPGDSV